MEKIKKSDPRGVFYDLFDEEVEAAHLTMRAALLVELRKAIKKTKMTQAEAAKFLMIGQPRVSYIVNGVTDKFSIDMLVKMLAKFGLAVEAKVKRPRKKVA